MEPYYYNCHNSNLELSDRFHIGARIDALAFVYGEFGIER